MCEAFSFLTIQLLEIESYLEKERIIPTPTNVENVMKQHNILTPYTIMLIPAIINHYGQYKYTPFEKLTKDSFIETKKYFERNKRYLTRYTLVSERYMHDY